MIICSIISIDYLEQQAEQEKERYATEEVGLLNQKVLIFCYYRCRGGRGG